MMWLVERFGVVSSLILAFASVSGVSTVASAGDPSAAVTIQFNRDIRPILSDNCFACHGPDKNKREADLRLDTAVGLLGDGDSIGTVVPENPDESELFARITSSDPEALMPPPDTGKTLTPTQIAILKQWIEQGADYEGHWAFQPLEVDPATATISDAEASARIDQFVDQAISDQGLEASAEADRVTLLRRLHFDLIGLPPSEAEVTAFLEDSSSDAYARQVDRLLQSPHFGERMAMWWLDLVRYADSVGYHGDQFVSVSPYRQYVIDSFNNSKPFDQFTIEQIGGDLLPEATREQQIASGYNRLGMMSAEGGVQDKEYLAKYIAERVRNVSGTWLGVTLGCAECHDHKFDPFTTRDFYRFEAFFADIQERGLYAGANSDGNWGSSIKVPTPAQEAELAKLDQQIADVRRVLDTPTPELAAAQETWEKSRVAWIVLEPEAVTSQQSATLTRQSDGSFLASGNSPPTDTYSIEIKQLPSSITAFRLEVLPDESLPQRGPGRVGNFVLTEVSVQIRSTSGEVLPVKLVNPSASFEQTDAAEANPYKKWSIESAIDGDEKGITWGWAVMSKFGEPHSAIFETKDDLTLAEGQSLTISLLQNHDNPQHTIGRFRLSATTAPRPLRAADLPPDAIATILAIPEGERNESQRAELATFYRGIAQLLEPQRQQLASLEKSRTELDSQIATTLVTTSVEPRMVRVLPRGNWMDDSGEVVSPAFPESLAPSQSTQDRLNRLDLAKWLVSDENALTGRTIVNRFWKLCFGAGLSRKLDDMGAQGEWPSHPELLDFLADRFRGTEWDVKRLIKTIVMTRAYRQSSLPSGRQMEADPYNRWLARQGRFRLDAEMVRDNALSISGLLVPTIGGRSVYPYQPPGYWAYLNFPQREWQNGSGDELYRRGLYTHWQRQYLHPSLLAFDAPSREECTADRPRSNTPIQSLVLLNDPTYVEAAKSFAEYLVRMEGDVPKKLNAAYMRAVSRSIQPEEQVVLEALLQQHLQEYQANPGAAKELLAVGARPAPEDLPPELLAAWTNVARVILNLHEVVTRN